MLNDLMEDIRRVGLVTEIDDVVVGETLETTASIVTRLQVKQDGKLLNLVYKDFRPDWIGGGVAELRWYEQFATTMAQRVAPHFYGGRFDLEAMRCYLFLEDVTQTHAPVPDDWPTETMPLSLLNGAVDKLAELHRQWWGRDEINAEMLVRGQGGPLRLAHATTPEVMGKYVAALQKALPGIWQEMGGVPAGTQHLVHQVLNTWPTLIDKRTTQTQHLTLIHGDYHIWNIFFPHDSEQGQPLILDWETYKRGFGVYDLAYLLLTCLTVEQWRELEQPLLQRYHHKLAIATYTWQNCLADYKLAIIANLFPPLLWHNKEQLLKTVTAFEDWSCEQLL